MEANRYERGRCTSRRRDEMVDDSSLKYWHDAGHVARRTLEAMRKKSPSANRGMMSFYQRRDSFAGTEETRIPGYHCSRRPSCSLHYGPFAVIPPEGWDREMVFQNGDLVKLDVGVHINGHIGDNALTLEVGNKGNHTEQIKAAKEARDSAIEMLHPNSVAQSWRCCCTTFNRCWLPAHTQSMRSPIETVGIARRSQRSILCMWSR